MRGHNKELLTTETRESFAKWFAESVDQRGLELLARIQAADTVEKRFAVLVVLLYPENMGRYSTLYLDTGATIRPSQWNHVGLGSQRMTSGMIEAFGQAYPQFIFWLATGTENAQHQGPRGLIEAYMAVCDKPRVKRLF